MHEQTMAEIDQIKAEASQQVADAHLLIDMAEAEIATFNLMRKKRLRSSLAEPRELAIQERILTIDEWHTMLEILDEYPSEDGLIKTKKNASFFLSVHCLF